MITKTNKSFKWLKTGVIYCLLTPVSCFLSTALFAQKAPKGKLLSYSHTSINPEIPVNDEYRLSWDDGKGTLKISNQFLSNEYNYTAEVSENVFRQATDFIKEQKLYAIKTKKKKKNSKSMPMSNPGVEDYTIQFEGKSYNYDIEDLNEEQRTAFHEFEELIKDIAKGLLPPTGKLVECSLSSESTVPGRGGDYASLSVQEGLGPVLTIGKSSSTPDGNQEKKYIVSAKDLRKLENLIIYENVYKAANYDGRDNSENAIVRRIFMKYDNGEVRQARWSHQAPPTEVTNAVSTISDFFTSLTKTYQPVSYPEGKMIYCSCAYTNNGLPVGQIQHSYYELIADEGMTPKVVFCEDRGDAEKTEYPATEQDVIELSNILRDKNVFLINGYHVDEQMTGGTSYRVHMEFSSGEKLNAAWFAEHPMPLAVETYAIILRYLKSITER